MTDDPRPGFNALRDKMLQHLEVHRAAKLEDLAQAAATFAYEALYLPGSDDVPHVQRTAPRRIYLCVSDDLADRDEPFSEVREEVTWARDEAMRVAVPYVRADLAALAAPKAEAWQPIETAPKDGTAVLVMRDIWPGTSSGHAEECNSHNTYVAAWWAGEGDDGKGRWVCYMDAVFDPTCPIVPTHWMPLPAPPAHQGATR